MIQIFEADTTPLAEYPDETYRSDAANRYFAEHPDSGPIIVRNGDLSTIYENVKAETIEPGYEKFHELGVKVPMKVTYHVRTVSQ